MKRNLRKARRVGALQRLETNLASAKEQLHNINKSDMISKSGVIERKQVLDKNISRMDAEIATLQSRIGGML